MEGYARSLLHEKEEQMKKIIRAAGAILIAAAAAGPFLCNPSDRVVRGITCGGLDVGGMDEGMLQSFIDGQNQKISGEKAHLVYKSVTADWTFKGLGAHVDRENEIQNLMTEGRKGNPVENWYVRWHAFFFSKEVEPDVVWDAGKLDSHISGLVKKYAAPPENPQPHITNQGTVTFSGGRAHLDINREKLKGNLEAVLHTGRGDTVEIPVSSSAFPPMTEEQGKTINRVLAYFTTRFPGDYNRSMNIRLAASKIDGRMLLPGETFSFNEATGYRTKEAGYLEAPVFLDGKLVPDAGGGACQVSTTLFNAVLLSGLSVISRTPHFAPVAYVPIGRDATVADKYIDFAFKNTLNHPIFIHAVYSPGALTVYILGNDRDVPTAADLALTKQKVLHHKTVCRTDPSQQEEQKTEEGNDGYDVTVTRTVRWGNGYVLTDSFRSVYDPVKTVITFRDQDQAEKAQQDADERAKNDELDQEGGNS